MSLGGRTSKRQQVLHDPRGAAGLLHHEVELALGDFVRGTLAEKFTHAEYGRERIIQFMRRPGHHLAHGSELFFLNELLLDELRFGDVPGGSDDARNVAVLVHKGTRADPEDSPPAVLVADAEFKLRGRFLARKQAADNGLDFGLVLEIRANRKSLAEVLAGSAAQNILHAGAHVGEPAVAVEDGDQVGEVRDEAPHKFLLLVQLPFDFTALGDVDQGPLQARDVAESVADGEAGGEAINHPAVFAAQLDFAVAKRAFFLDLAY